MKMLACGWLQKAKPDQRIPFSDKLEREIDAGLALGKAMAWAMDQLKTKAPTASTVEATPMYRGKSSHLLGYRN